MHPKESTGCLCTCLALDRLHSPAAGFEDQRFVLQEGREGNKSHFKIVESLLVMLNSFVDTEDGSERLNVFCFKPGERILSVLRSEATVVAIPAPSLSLMGFCLVEGFLISYLAPWFNSFMLPATLIRFYSVRCSEFC